MYSLDKVHMMLDEVINNGNIVDTMRNNVLGPLLTMEKLPK